MNKLIRNSTLLMLCQIGGMFIPLLELPILTRNLSSSEYGSLIYVISAALLASVFIEFGFTFSASRQIAEAEGDKITIGRVCSDVFLAKIGLSVISIIFLYIFIISSKNIAIPFEWIILIFLMAVSMGFSPIWYFIGIERLAIPAILDIVIRFLGFISLYYLLPICPKPETALMIMVVAGFINTLVPSLLMIKSIELQRLSLQRSVLIIKESFHLFVFKSIHSIQQSLSSLLLGRFGSAHLVGIFTPAEKLNRAVISLMTPIVNVFFPFFIKTKIRSEKKFTLIFFMFTILMFILLSICSVVIYYAAPVIINLIFGDNYHSSARVLQILALAIPFKGLNIILNIMWFVPCKQEKIVNKILVLNLFLLLPLSYLTLSSSNLIGFAVGIVIIELITSCILLLIANKLYKY